MARSTKGWKKKDDYTYKNRDNWARAEVVHNPNYKPGGYEDKWMAQVFVEGYAVKYSQFSKKKDARDYILDYIDSHPSPELTCDDCGSSNVRVGSKDEGRKDKVWYICDECGYESPGRFVVR